jgi:hypothetical protein
MTAPAKKIFCCAHKRGGFLRMRAFARRGGRGGLILRTSLGVFEKSMGEKSTSGELDRQGASQASYGAILGRFYPPHHSLLCLISRSQRRETVADIVAGTCLDGLILVDTKNYQRLDFIDVYQGMLISIKPIKGIKSQLLCQLS